MKILYAAGLSPKESSLYRLWALERLGHQVIDSADGEVTAWAEETLDHAAAPLPRNLREAIEERLLAWPGPAVGSGTSP